MDAHPESRLLQPAARLALASRLEWLGTAGATIDLDADCHISDPDDLPPAVQARLKDDPGYFHGRPISAEQLLAELDVAGVGAALCWQNPAATAYTGPPADDAGSLWRANLYVARAAARYPRRIVPAGWTDPRALGTEGACELAGRCVRELGFAVVKMNPAQNRYPMSSPEVIAVARHIASLGAVPAFHVGADTPYTPAEGVAAVLDAVAPSPVIAVHLGGGGASYDDQDPLCRGLRSLLLANARLFAIESAKRDTHIESDLLAAASAGALARLALGSDAPYGRVAWNFGGARAVLASLRDPRHPDPRIRAGHARVPEAACRGFLGANIAALLLQAHRQVLERHA